MDPFAPPQLDANPAPVEADPPLKTPDLRTVVLQAAALVVYQVPARFFLALSPLAWLSWIACAAFLWGRGRHERFGPGPGQWQRSVALVVAVHAAMDGLPVIATLAANEPVLPLLTPFLGWSTATLVGLSVGLSAAPAPKPKAKRKPRLPVPARGSLEPLFGGGHREDDLVDPYKGATTLHMPHVPDEQ